MGIARGLEYLHSRHILHRDLAARNILLSEYDYNTPKICDFERAVVETFNEQDNEWNYYDFQNTAVPVQWTAPEVVKTMSPLKSTCYTQKTDVFSLGILICELLNRGFPPYERYDYKRITEKTYTYPQILHDTQMTEVASIAMECLTYRPTLRASAEEIGNESIRIISKMTPRPNPDEVSSGSSTYVDLYHQ
jgi:serine/threonine protein kinase